MSMNQTDLLQLLKTARDKGAMEVHLKVPQRPLLRLGGLLVSTDLAPLGPKDTLQAAMALCSLARLEIPIATLTDYEFGLGVPDVGRFLVHIYKQRGTVGLVVHRMSLKIPSLASLGFPMGISKVLERPGLTLLGGGVRRYALMASLVENFNNRVRGYAVTLESPLTHLHRDSLATVAQREVGLDVQTFSEGIRHAIRQEADLLAVGCVPDESTADSVLTAAEQGCTVLCCLPSISSKDTAWQLGRRFRPEYRKDYELRLRNQLLASLCIPDAGEPEVSTRFDSEEATFTGILPKAAAAATLYK